MSDRPKMMQRAAFGNTLLELGEKIPNLVVLDADISSSLYTSQFAKRFPGSSRRPAKGQRKGYSMNIPLPPEAGDELFVRSFTESVPQRIERFRPDVIVSQLGVDTFRSDPLAHLNVTTEGFCTMVGMIKSLAPKWVALGGGGYDVAYVARAWTLAWAIMNDVQAPDEIPLSFLQQFSGAGFPDRKLRDARR